MASGRNARSPGGRKARARIPEPVPEIVDEPVAGLAPRRAALEAVAELLGQGRALALDDALAGAGARAGVAGPDAALARAIATATFRRLGFLKAALAARLAEGLPEDEPRFLALLATGAAQILDLSVPDHAAVDLAVRLAKAEPRLRHRAGLVNAVLRRIAREAEEIRAAETNPLADNTPDWLRQRWIAAYGRESAERIARAHLSGAAIDITVPAGADRWADMLAAVLLPTGSLRLSDTRTPVAELPGFVEGAWWVQDAAAAIPARLLHVRPNERVADLCAAPGGKTAQLAAAGAAVTAVDRSGPRLRRLSENLGRLSLEAKIVVADALDLDEPPFDAVLLDAPCSATGTIRRHPDVAWTKSEADIGRLVALQERLLDKAADLLKPGGRLVYCTCSLEREEGEEQVARFLDRHPDFALDPVRPDEIGGLSGLIDAAGHLRTLPSGEPAMDGFFASRLLKRA
ncbi:Ribosomal RNA small subunit methyltransferase B [Methylobacterium jeotgali]|uniref:Ribosomal RNA small subunit methyltransferase B n=2 Tax=Methylobacteriaceae TaxID=119045 RepID=A0ABQ4SWP1_9HYPH|nr:16S rRNA m(5)C967 methyltransferase [Methylobacterium sp.]GJE06308.1 Ribosomal RNA small subunit methyltransferase B [Methylobacterium jeotgali]